MLSRERFPKDVISLVRKVRKLLHNTRVYEIDAYTKSFVSRISLGILCTLVISNKNFSSLQTICFPLSYIFAKL